MPNNGNDTDRTDLPELSHLSTQEQTLVKALLSGQPEAQALRTAGYAEGTIRGGYQRIIQRDRIQQAIHAAMDRAGISPDLLATRMREGLDASTADQVTIKKNGDSLVIAGGPDYAIRHKYLETALRVGGHEPGKETESEESYEEQILRLRGVQAK